MYFQGDHITSLEIFGSGIAVEEFGKTEKQKGLFVTAEIPIGTSTLSPKFGKIQRQKIPQEEADCNYTGLIGL